MGWGRSAWQCSGAGLLAGLLLAACQETSDTAKPVPYNGPLMQTEHVRLLISDSARLQIRLTAPLEEDYENGDRLYPKGARVLFYDKPGKVVLNTIQAKWVKYTSNEQRYTLRGDVRVANEPKQQRLFTEELFYDRNKQKIYTDPKRFVRVQSPVDSLTGYGLEANQDFSRYRVLRLSGRLDASGTQQ